MSNTRPTPNTANPKFTDTTPPADDVVTDDGTVPETNRSRDDEELDALRGRDAEELATLRAENERLRNDRDGVVTPADKNADGEAFTRVGYNGIVNTEVPSHADNAQSQIVFRDPRTGTEHGPMSVADWPAYSQENGL